MKKKKAKKITVGHLKKLRGGRMSQGETNSERMPSETKEKQAGGRDSQA